jgi:hypothetical protein
VLWVSQLYLLPFLWAPHIVSHQFLAPGLRAEKDLEGCVVAFKLHFVARRTLSLGVGGRGPVAVKRTCCSVTHCFAPLGPGPWTFENHRLQLTLSFKHGGTVA